MALFNHLFPYSNLHDINLDWIISIIKSIDPAVIQALQELTPDIIEQVTQKVNEAQAAAIAAQSSASEANTARENAATSAAEAAQDATETATNAAAASADAVRAENAANNAETAITNAITPEFLGITQNSTYVSSTTVAQYQVSGKTALVNIDCVMNGTKSEEYWTPIYTLGKPVSGTFFDWGFIGGTTKVKVKIEESSVYIVSENITGPAGFLLFASPCFTT